MSLVKADIEQSIATPTIDNPTKRNALSEALIDGLTNAIEDLRLKKTRAIILRALPGVKVWTAGHVADELPAWG